MTRAIADKARTIRIPVHMVEKLNRVTHVERQLVQRLGREPEPAEIAAELKITVREVRDILRVAQMPVSLEKPIGDEDESELGDFVADEAVEEPFEAATENLQREDIQQALDALPERERQVIELRYGLRGHEPLTLEEVGRAFGVTRERDPPDREQHAAQAEAAARGAAPARADLAGPFAAPRCAGNLPFATGRKEHSRCQTNSG